MGKKMLTLNIGASAVELAEYEASGRQVRLVNYGKAALAAPLDIENAATVLPSALWEIMRAKGIRPGKVAVSLSSQLAFPRSASIMATSADKFAQYVRNEIEQNVPYPIDDMVCDHIVLGDTETGEKSVLIVAAKVDQVEAVTDALVSAGFTPEVVGVASIATVNVLRAMTGDDGSCSVILDLGAKTTSLIITEGEKLYNRSIPTAGNNITKEIAQALGCTQEEAEAYKCENAYVSLGGVVEDEDETRDRVAKICRSVLTRLHAEISRSINFYRSQQGGSAPTKLYLTGGTSMLPQLAEFFQDSLKIEVEYLNPFNVIATGSAVDATQLESDVTVLAATSGLALQQVGAAPYAINLMPPSILEARAEVARIPFVAIGAVAIAAASALWMLACQSDAKAVEDQVAAAEGAASTAQAMTQAVADAEKKLKNAEADAKRVREELATRGQILDHFNLVRTELEALRASKDEAGEPNGIECWIAGWDERTVERTVEPEVKPGARSRKSAAPTIVRERVATVTIRSWQDRKDQTKAPGRVCTALAAHDEVISASEVQGRTEYFGVRECLQQFDIDIKFKEVE